MLNSSTLMVVALSAMMPAQGPQAPVVYGPAPVGMVAGGFYQGPGLAPPQGCIACQGSGYRCSGPFADCVGPCAPSWNLEAKLRKFCQFLCYTPAYKTPCCFKTCSSYRPPLYEWFPVCVEGAPHAMPCVPPVNSCPSCFKFGNIRFAPPSGGTANCPTGTCR